MTKTTGKSLWIWSFALVLFVCVSATNIAITSMLGGFLMDDEGAISLISGEVEYVSAHESADQETDLQLAALDAQPSMEPEQLYDDVPRGLTASPSVYAPVTAPQMNDQKKPGFEAGDDTAVWTTNTPVEIFRLSYENGEQVLTVNSNNGEKVIAPGTKSSYTFKLKNTGGVALDYTVELDAYFTPADIEIPVTGRLNRYDSAWIVGGKEEYAEVSVLDTAKDRATLGAGKYTYYTLDWIWPFEGGDDTLDTELGNLAATQDLAFTIVIKTVASESDDPDDDGGITPPQTGDRTTMWFALAVGSAALMVVLLAYQKKRVVA